MEATAEVATAKKMKSDAAKAEADKKKSEADEAIEIATKNKQKADSALEKAEGLKKEWTDANVKFIKDKDAAVKASAVASKNEPVSEGESKPADTPATVVEVPAAADTAAP